MGFEAEIITFALIFIFFMKRWLFALALCLIFSACRKEDFKRNPYLPELRFSRQINIDLPLYNKLKTPLTPVLLEGIGLRGVVVINTGGSFVAWERACPDRLLTDCSTMQLKDNIFLECPCNQLIYNLVNGAPTQGNSDFTLLNYRVSVNANLLTIYN